MRVISLRVAVFSLVLCGTSPFVVAQEGSLKTADSLYNVGQWKSAAYWYENFVTSNKEKASAVVYNRLGYAKHNTGSYKEALNAYILAASKNPPPRFCPSCIPEWPDHMLFSTTGPMPFSTFKKRWQVVMPILAS